MPVFKRSSVWFRGVLRSSRGLRTVIKCRRNVRSNYGLYLLITLVLATTALRNLTRIRREFLQLDGRAADVTNKVASQRDVDLRHHRGHGNRSEFTRWRNEVRSLCDGRMSVYGGSFARLRDVIVNRKLFSAERFGGESLNDVMNQDVGAEFYQLHPGSFQLFGCKQNVNTRLIQFAKRNYLSNWLAATEMTSYPDAREGHRRRETGTTVAVMRDEYANFYHTTSDWYNVFLATIFFADVSEVRVLLVDAHPAGPLDDVWDELFDGTKRLSQLDSDTPTQFDDLIWATPGHRGLFEQHFRRRLPFIEEFRNFVLNRHHIDFQRTVDCSNVSVMLVWRRDYVTHPRNPTAIVRRKIANEHELETHLRRENPTMRFTGVQLDQLPFSAQLRAATDSDVIIGMHGAGLTHAMFSPPGSALIELMPGYNTATNWHFRSIARWRNLVYENWIADQLSDDATNAYRTNVSPEAVNKLLRKAVGRMCRINTRAADESKN